MEHSIAQKTYLNQEVKMNINIISKRHSALEIAKALNAVAVFIRENNEEPQNITLKDGKILIQIS